MHADVCRFKWNCLADSPDDIQLHPWMHGEHPWPHFIKKPSQTIEIVTRETPDKQAAEIFHRRMAIAQTFHWHRHDHHIAIGEKPAKFLRFPLLNSHNQVGAS